MNREFLLRVLTTMPDEAFGYIVIACANVVKTYEANHGFIPASTKSFVELAKAINEYLGGEYIEMDVVKAHNSTLFE